MSLGSTISKTSARVSSGLKTRETQAKWFYCFRAFGNLMKPNARVFGITSPTKKISLNYHLNKFSQSLRREICSILIQMCLTCMILSPNCYAVTSLENSLTDLTLLPSCLSVPSEHVASQSKWQSADLDSLKLAKESKRVWPAPFRGNVCIYVPVKSKLKHPPRATPPGI